MDDPTRRCENDTDNGTRLLGVPGPKREPHFFAADRCPARPGQTWPLTIDLQPRFFVPRSA